MKCSKTYLKLILSLGFLLFRLFPDEAQPLTIPLQTRLPLDSIIRKSLLHSLNHFLELKDSPATQNAWVTPGCIPETQILLDELIGIEKNEKLNNNSYYAASLRNIVKQDDSSWLIQITYLNSSDSLTDLRLFFNIIGKRDGDNWSFHSPLKQNTEGWKTLKRKSVVFHYKNTINTKNATNYAKMVYKFDRKLKSSITFTDYYCCENFPEAERLAGIEFKSDYNGFRRNSFLTHLQNSSLHINGIFGSRMREVDPHDLWHSRLHYVVSVSVINRPVDEGTAYLNGGSWGISWRVILKTFKVWAAAHPDADWLALYNESKNFDEKSGFPLNVDMVINALIVQKLEKEKGINAVLELVSCGKKTKDNENYFKALEKQTGISKSSFNMEIAKLINES